MVPVSDECVQHALSADAIRTCPNRFWASGRPNSPFSLCGGEELEESHRGKFLGKPRRAISRFRQQDAQTPPAPRVKAEGGGIVQDRNAPLAQCARLRRACRRDARALGATLRCALLQGEVFGEPRRACAVRAPLARTRASRPRTRRNPQVRAFAGAGLVASLGVPSPVSGTPPSPLVGAGGRGDEGATAHGNAGASLPGTRPLRGARASGAHAGGTPALPVQPSGVRAFAGAGLVASPGVPSPVSGTPSSPLVGEGGRGDEGQMRTGTPQTGRLARKRSPCERIREDQGDGRSISGDR